MGKSSIDQNGFRRQTANPVSMVGVFPYTGEQIDYDGAMGLDPKKIYWVFRPPEELFHPDALDSFNGIPIRIGHVMLGENFKAVDDEPADGCIYNARQSLDMPEYLIAEFTIYTDKMKNVLSKGRVKELSLGYRCQYVPCEGVYKGKPYQFKQVNLRGNHLALVEHGRCGSSVCVCDKALITFDSLPKEMEDMDTDKEKKGLEKVQKLAEAVKNGDEQACQDCLDFYDLTPEQRKEALAYVKGKKDKKEEKSDTPTEDAKVKDGEVPPPPPPPPAEEEKKEDAPPPAEEKPAEEPPPAKEEVPPAEPPPAEPPAEAPAADCGKKGKKSTKDEAVTEPSIPVPKQNLEGAVTPDKDKKPAEDCKGTKDNESKDCDTKDCGTKDEKKSDECKCEDECKDGKCKDESGDGKCDKCEKPMTEDKDDKPKDAKECETEEVEEVVVGEDEKLPPPEQDIPSKMGKEEGEQDIKAGEKPVVAQDQYKEFAAEYAKAQALAEKVRPFIKETFDSALMREVEVARFAAKHIAGLAFAADAADSEVLAAVHGMLAHVAMDSAKETPKVFGMDEAIKVEQPKVETPVVNTAKKLTAFLNA